jgi:hypothetical protein
MKIVETYIFSFNRPAQLELLLNSIDEFDLDNQLSVSVQYGFSEEQFENGYKILIGRFPHIKFINENHYVKPKYLNPIFGYWIFNCFYWIRNYRFRKCVSNFRQIMLSEIKNSSFDYFMFLTDDSIFYQEIVIQNHLLGKIKEDPDYSYGMAYGNNIFGGHYQTFDSYIRWELDFSKKLDFWNYPFSVDGRIYNREFLFKTLSKVSFSNPNTLETLVGRFCKNHNIFNKISANLKGSLVGFELNRVQKTYNNNSMNLSIYTINDYFMNGFKLKLEFNELSVDSFHPEILKISMERDNDKVLLFGNALIG